MELLAEHFAPIAHPSLGLREPAHLARATLIVFEWRNTDPAHPTWPLWLERAGVSVEPHAVLRFTDESHAIAAAVTGQGCALLSRVLVKALPKGRVKEIKSGPRGQIVRNFT